MGGNLLVGFGFVTFLNSSSVDKVVKKANHMVDGKKVDPKIAIPRKVPKQNQFKKIFIGGLASDTTTNDVREYFEKYGKDLDSFLLNLKKLQNGFAVKVFIKSSRKVWNASEHSPRKSCRLYKVEEELALTLEMVHAIWRTNAFLFRSRMATNECTHVPATGKNGSLKRYQIAVSKRGWWLFAPEPASLGSLGLLVHRAEHKFSFRAVGQKEQLV
eukprot:gene15203-6405_t